MSLSDLLAPARAAWADREAREQFLLAGLAALLAALVLWYAVLAPALSWRAEARRAHDAAVADYETVLAGVARYQELASEAQAVGGGTPLRTLVGASATARELPISRVQPLDAGALGVWFDAAPADRLMAWLADLSREDGVVVERASFDREGDNVVRAQIIVRRPGDAP
ncbi:type II secretion system protein GspM [Maricaulaceae bacterium MS644]